MDVLVEKIGLALGPVVGKALEDPSVVEVLINPDGVVRIEQLGGAGVQATGTRVAPANILAAVGAVASLLGTVVNSESPVLQGELPVSGARIQAFVPPIVPRPCLAIRKKASAYYPLASYVETGRMSSACRRAIEEGVRGRRNILVSGGTGSGKTTLVNAIIGEIAVQAPRDRLVILEDTTELQPRSDDVVQLRTSAHVDMRALLRGTLRMRPDRILVGEVRGGEANDMLDAWNTGHPGGVCTVHADHPHGALLRIERLAAQGTVNGKAPREAVAEAVGLVVQAERGPEGPRIREVAEVRSLGADGNYRIETLADHEGSSPDREPPSDRRTQG